MSLVHSRRTNMMMTAIIIAIITFVTKIDVSFSFSLIEVPSSMSRYHPTNSNSNYKSKNRRSSSSTLLNINLEDRQQARQQQQQQQQPQQQQIISPILDTKRDGDNTDMDMDMDLGDNSETMLRFRGVGRLYEQNQNQQTPTSILRRLQSSTVAIIGIGGVGSWAAEAICRSGVGNILLVDLDDVCISNTNRQLHATSSNVGKMKIDVMKHRLLDINPNCKVTLIHDFITEDNVFDIVRGFAGKNDNYIDNNDDEEEDNDNNNNKNVVDNGGTSMHTYGQRVDVIIDAIDGNTEKAALIAAACIKDIPIVTCGGAAGRIDPSQIVCQDLSQSVECKLLFWTKKKTTVPAA